MVALRLWGGRAYKCRVSVGLAVFCRLSSGGRENSGDQTDGAAAGHVVPGAVHVVVLQTGPYTQQRSLGDGPAAMLSQGLSTSSSSSMSV